MLSWIAIIILFSAAAFVIDIFFRRRGPIWLETPKLGDDWFCKDDIGRTIKNIIQIADREWVLRCKGDLKKFRNGMLSEISFLCPYNENEFIEVKKFLDDNIQTLHEYAMKRTKFYPKKH